MNRRELFKKLGLTVGLALTLGITSQAIAKDKITFKFDSYISETAGPSKVDNWFLTELENRTNGAVEVRRFWSSSLTKVGEHLSAIADGTSEVSLISPGYYQADLPVTRGLEWYYRMNRPDALQLVSRDVYEQFEPLKTEWEKRHNAKVLYWTTWNYAPLISKTPIQNIDDIKGKRFRGYGISNDVLKRLGATPVPMAAPEVYTALERGVLDGVYGFDFITAVAYKLHEIAPHFTDIGDGPHAPSAVVMNIDFYNKLPDSVKQTIDELVDELYAGKYAELINDYMEEYVKLALDEGVKFNIFSPEEKAKAKEMVQPAQINLWKDSVAKSAKVDGEQMQELIDQAIAKYDSQGKVLRPSEIAEKLSK